MSGGKSVRAILATGLVLVAAVLLHHHPYLSADGARLEHDWFTMHQVDALHVARAAAEGHVAPAWSPWLLGGAPMYGVSTKPFSYPPFLLAVHALGPVLAMNVLLLVHLLVGAAGAVLLARRLGLTGVAPAACGALFSLARFPAAGFVSMPFGGGYAASWWPFTLICVLDLARCRRPLRAGAWLGTLLALQWHAGGEASLYWLACFAGALAAPYMVRPWQARELAAVLSGGSIAAVVLLGLGAVRLFPELAWLEASGRAEPLGVELARDGAIEEALARAGHGSRLRLFLEHLFAELDGGGRWTLIVGSLLGAATGWRRRAWLGVVAGTAVCAILASGALHDWAYELLPGYDRMRRHTRFVQIVGFGAIFLAGFGIERAVPARAGGRPRRAGLAAAVALAVLADTSALPGVRYSLRELDSPAERLELTREQLSPVLAHEGPARLHHQAHREQAYWVALGIETTGGALGGPGSGNALYHEILGEWTSAAHLESRVPAVLDVLNVVYVAARGPLSHPHLELVSSRAHLEPDVRERLRRAGWKPIQLYRRSTARPRACAVRAPTLVVGEAAARRAAVVGALRGDSFDAGATVLAEDLDLALADLTPERAAGFGAILLAGLAPADPAVPAWLCAAGELRDAPPGALWTPTGGAGATELRPIAPARFSRTSTTIDVDVSGLDERFLLLSELTTLHRGWTAKIDGARVAPYRADGLVTLLRLPAGARRVRLEYAPPGIAVGAAVSAATLVVLLAAAAQALRSRSTRHRRDAAARPASGSASGP